MRTERGLSRLVGFSDGVVAIAITLLVLPLVTAATQVDVDAGTFLVENAYQLLVLVLSFAVIGRFWIAYDAVRSAKDRPTKLALFERLYIDPATPGLRTGNPMAEPVMGGLPRYDGEKLGTPAKPQPTP